MFASLKPEKNSPDFATPPLVSPRNDCRNSILMTRQYPELGNVSDWLKQIFSQSEALPRS